MAFQTNSLSMGLTNFLSLGLPLNTLSNHPIGNLKSKGGEAHLYISSKVLQPNYCSNSSIPPYRVKLCLVHLITFIHTLSQLMQIETAPLSTRTASYAHVSITRTTSIGIYQCERKEGRTKESISLETHTLCRYASEAKIHLYSNGTEEGGSFQNLHISIKQ